MTQSVRDAINDAETLRLFSVALPFWPDIHMARAFQGTATFQADVWIAQWQGQRAGSLPAPLETADQAAACARIAADAAFRAVPELRCCP